MAWLNLALNISVKSIKRADWKVQSVQYGIYYCISDFLPWIQNPYADAYLEDFVQKHLQARTLV